MDPLEAQMSDLGDDLKEIGNRTRGIFPIGSSYFYDFTTGVFESKKS